MNHFAGKDLYTILRISHTASIQDIKSSYKALAMELHPDKHDGCTKKLAEFKEVNEAYSILKDINKRREYDVTYGLRFGHRFNKNRSSPLPKDYRKVYAPRPPPDWKFVWDHQKHYDMHYGDGFKKEAIREAKLQAQKDGFYNYESPLGRGFSFTRDTNDNNTTTSSSSNNYTPYNPYSKAPQGPPKIVFEYEEGEMSDATKGKLHIRHREKIIDDLNERRSVRQKQQQQNDWNHQQQHRYHHTTYNMGTASRKNALYSSTGTNDCVIL